MMAKSSKYVKFSFPISAYRPDALQNNYTMKELRQEYSRLRDVAQKRIHRLEQSEFAESQTVKYNKDRYPTLKNVSDKSELTHLLSDLSRFLTAQRGSISGMREERRKSIDTWHENGVDFVNESNYQDWVEFLSYAKDFIGFSYLETAKEMYEQGQQAGLSGSDLRANFETYVENYKGSGSIMGGWDE